MRRAGGFCYVHGMLYVYLTAHIIHIIGMVVYSKV